MKSLLEELPRIVAEGKREAEQILERLEGNYRIGLQTREVVIPSKDTKIDDLFKKGRAIAADGVSAGRLIYGDNLLAMAALLAGDEDSASLRGKVDLIYIDPPFDSKADYRTKVTLLDGSVEHPAFQQFYQELMDEGLAGKVDENDDDTSSTGDLIAVELRDGYEQYDFALPFILREKEEEIRDRVLRAEELEAFTVLPLQKLKDLVGKGDRFVSEDVETKTRFGDYRVAGGVMTATGYNDYIARVVRRIGDMLSQPLTKSAQVYANKSKFPYLQFNRAQVAAVIDAYVRKQLFNSPFDPLADENWRVLLLDIVSEHIIKAVAHKLLQTEGTEVAGEAEVAYRRLSEVEKIAMRESSSMPVRKCIYSRLPYPSRSGLLEKAFMEAADQDSSVEAFCKVNEHKHDFVRLRYVKEDGLPGFYSPDFLLRTDSAIFLVETKAEGQTSHPNVQRKRTAAIAWCDRVNVLKSEERSQRVWNYVLLGEDVFYRWRDGGGSVKEMLEFARLRSQGERGQQRLL